MVPLYLNLQLCLLLSNAVQHCHLLITVVVAAALLCLVQRLQCKCQLEVDELSVTLKNRVQMLIATNTCLITASVSDM